MLAPIAVSTSALLIALHPRIDPIYRSSLRQAVYQLLYQPFLTSAVVQDGGAYIDSVVSLFLCTLIFAFKELNVE